MKKQVYLQPTMVVLQVEQKTALLGSSVTSVSSNAEITGGTTGSSEAARVKDYSVWNEDWSD